MKEMNKINVNNDMALEEHLSMLANHNHIIPSDNLLSNIQAQITRQKMAIWSKPKTIMMTIFIILVVMLNVLTIWSAYTKGPSDVSQMSNEFSVNNQLYK
jgi:hypothetical protein